MRGVLLATGLASASGAPAAGAVTANTAELLRLIEDDRFERPSAQLESRAPSLRAHGLDSSKLVDRARRACFTDILDPSFGGVGTHRCTVKCSPHSDCADDNSPGCWCGGLSAVDSDLRDKSLCVDANLCEEMCKVTQNCYSYSYSTDSAHPICFLHGYAALESCGVLGSDSDTVTDGDYSRFGWVWTHLLSKSQVLRFNHLDNTCLLGEGVQVANAAYIDLDGVYVSHRSFEEDQALAAPWHYDHWNHTDLKVTASWHHSNCGWAVRRELVTATSTSGCVDDDDLLQAAFQDDRADSVATCADVATWAGDTYCSHALLAQICPATCNVDCSADNNAAVADLLALLPSLGSGSTCADVSCSADPMFSLVCPETCPATSTRRLSLSSVDKQEMKAFASNFVQHLEEKRRLGYECDATDGCPSSPVWEEVMVSFNTRTNEKRTGVQVEGTCTAINSANYPFQNDKDSTTTGFYDVYAFNRPADTSLAMKPVCTKSTSFVKHGSKYCRQFRMSPSNVARLESSSPVNAGSALMSGWPDGEGADFGSTYTVSHADGTTEELFGGWTSLKPSDSRYKDRLLADACYNKCAGTNPKDSDFVGESFCNGNVGSLGDGSSGFGPTSTAICLDRAGCSRLCTELGDLCHSFDMHKTLNLCTLHNDACESTDVADENALFDSDDFDFYKKETTVDVTVTGIVADTAKVFSVPVPPSGEDYVIGCYSSASNVCVGVNGMELTILSTSDIASLDLLCKVTSIADIAPTTTCPGTSAPLGSSVIRHESQSSQCMVEVSGLDDTLRNGIYKKFAYVDCTSSANSATALPFAEYDGHVTNCNVLENAEAYVSADGLNRITYKDPATDGTNMCDGWVFSTKETSISTVNLVSTVWSPRSGLSTVYDSARGRLLVIGGYTEDSGYTSDVYASSDNGLTFQLLATNQFPARARSAAVYVDSVNRVVIAAGGFATSSGALDMLSDVWYSDDGGVKWTQQASSDVGFTKRMGHSMAVDSNGNIMLVGGWCSTCGGDLSNDVWTANMVSPSAWSQVLENAPFSARFMAGLSYDSGNGQFILSGGRAAGTSSSRRLDSQDTHSAWLVADRDATEIAGCQLSTNTVECCSNAQCASGFSCYYAAGEGACRASSCSNLAGDGTCNLGGCKAGFFLSSDGGCVPDRSACQALENANINNLFTDASYKTTVDITDGVGGYSIASFTDVEGSVYLGSDQIVLFDGWPLVGFSNDSPDSWTAWDNFVNEYNKAAAEGRTVTLTFGQWTTSLAGANVAHLEAMGWTESTWNTWPIGSMVKHSDFDEYPECLPALFRTIEAELNENHFCTWASLDQEVRDAWIAFGVGQDLWEGCPVTELAYPIIECGPGGPTGSSEVWVSATGASWSKAGSIPARYDHGSVYDPVRGVTWLLPGATSADAYDSTAFRSTDGGATWSSLSLPGHGPSGFAVEGIHAFPNVRSYGAVLGGDGKVLLVGGFRQHGGFSTNVYSTQASGNDETGNIFGIEDGWIRQFKSWRNGTEYHSAWGSDWGLDDCTTNAGADASVNLLTTDSWYYIEPPFVPAASLTELCVKEPICPLRTTCNLPTYRFIFDYERMFGAKSWPTATVSTVPTDNWHYTTIRSYWRVDSIIDVTNLNHYEPVTQRTTPGATRVSINNIPAGIATVWASVVSSDPTSVKYNFDTSYAQSTGYANWKSDLIRVQCYDDTTSNSTATVRIQFDGIYTTSELGVSVMRFPIGGGAPTVLPATLVDSDTGTWYVDGACYGDFIATYDLDECAAGTHNCDKNAACSNTAGSFSCECNTGWSGSGQVCQRVEHLHPNFGFRQRVQVAVTKRYANSMNSGVRLGGVQIFSDYECSNEISYSTTTDMYSNRETSYWKRSDVGCSDSLQQYKTETDVTLCAAACAEDQKCVAFELGDQCYFFTTVGVMDQKDTFSCTSGETCTCFTKKVGFHSTPAYPGFENVGPSSPWRSLGLTFAPGFGDAVELDFDLLETQRVGSIKVLAPEVAGASGFVGDDQDSTCKTGEQQRSSYMPKKMAVRLGPALNSGETILDVEGIVLRQGEGELTSHTSSWITSVMASSNTQEGTGCVSLRCGQRSDFKGTRLAGEVSHFHNVTTDCACKQLCLGMVDQGCRSYLFGEEAEHNFDGSTDTRPHSFCFLSSDQFDESHGYDESKSAGIQWYGGSVDVVVTGFSPSRITTPGEVFDLTIHGAHFNVQGTERLKIVDSTDSADACSQPPSAYVDGISCSSPYVCAGKASTSSDSSLTWNSLRIGATASQASTLTLCLCERHCFSRDSWVELPGKLSVDPSFITWRAKAHTDGATNTALTSVDSVVIETFGDDTTIIPEDVNSFTLVLERDPLYLGQDDIAVTGDTALWDFYFMPVSGEHAVACDSTIAVTPGVSTPRQTGNALVYTIARGNLDGRYLVCVCTESCDQTGASYVALPTSGSSGVRMLTIQNERDLTRDVTGPYHHQQWSGSALDGRTKMFHIYGYYDSPSYQSHLMFSAFDSCPDSSTAATTSKDWFFPAGFGYGAATFLNNTHLAYNMPTLGTISPHTPLFGERGEVPVDAVRSTAAGRFSICFCGNDDVPEIGSVSDSANFDTVTAGATTFTDSAAGVVLNAAGGAYTINVVDTGDMSSTPIPDIAGGDGDAPNALALNSDSTKIAYERRNPNADGTGVAAYQLFESTIADGTYPAPVTLADYATVGRVEALTYSSTDTLAVGRYQSLELYDDNGLVASKSTDSIVTSLAFHPEDHSLLAVGGPAGIEFVRTSSDLVVESALPWDDNTEIKVNGLCIHEVASNTHSRQIFAKSCDAANVHPINAIFDASLATINTESGWLQGAIRLDNGVTGDGATCLMPSGAIGTGSPVVAGPCSRGHEWLFDNRGGKSLRLPSDSNLCVSLGSSTSNGNPLQVGACGNDVWSLPSTGSVSLSWAPDGSRLFASKDTSLYIFEYKPDRHSTQPDTATVGDHNSVLVQTWTSTVSGHSQFVSTLDGLAAITTSGSDISLTAHAASSGSTVDASGAIAGFGVLSHNEIIVARVNDAGTGVAVEKRDLSLPVCTEKVGELAWSQRAFTGLDWYLPLAQRTVIEVAGENLDGADDRIALVDTGLSCGTGVEQLNTLVRRLGDDTSSNSRGTLSAAKDFAPIGAELHTENNTISESAFYIEESRYKIYPWSYCAGGNMDMTTSIEIEEQNCFNKCYNNDCKHEQCFCDGFQPQFDRGNDATSICLPKVLCMDLCDQTPGCVGVEMHATLPRCFLNINNCWENASPPDWSNPQELGWSSDYHFLVKDQSQTLREYGFVPSRFCAGRNAGSTVLPASMQAHKCSVKCTGNSAAECSGYEAIGGGSSFSSNTDAYIGKGEWQKYYPEWTVSDASDSDALCVDTSTCLNFCSDLNNAAGEKVCVGVDAHSSKDRCYLNLKDSASTAIYHTTEDTHTIAGRTCLEDLFNGQLTYDTNWQFYYVAPDAAPSPGRRRLMQNSDVADGAVVPWRHDALSSNGRRLLFAPTTIGTPNTGGSLKVCFCDSQALPYSASGSGARTTCSEAADFGLLLGYVHATQLECRVDIPQFRRNACRLTKAVSDDNEYSSVVCGVRERDHPLAMIETEWPNLLKPADPPAPLSAFESWCAIEPPF